MNFSLGCGIGYGYLHRIPTRAAPTDTHSKNVLPSAVIDSSEELVARDHTEVHLITSLFYEMYLVDCFSLSKTQVLCLQMTPVDAHSPSCEIDLHQIEGAVQDLCVPSPTQSTVDLGNQISF